METSVGLEEIWKEIGNDGPIVAAAIHNGHQLRKEVAMLLALSEEDRLREEDPFTEEWVYVGNTQIVGLHSRFEVDLNRPRENAVYQKPEDAWGLKIYNTPPPKEIVARSLEEYDAFYRNAHKLFSELERKYGRFVVLDLHSYNHLRDGANMPPADPAANPEVNLGTGSMDRDKWAPIVDRFIADLSKFNYNGRNLDVRENIKFKGGYFSKWIHQNFPTSACSISIEFKKFFMDEWTGIPDKKQLHDIGLALQSTIPGILHELGAL